MAVGFREDFSYLNTGLGEDPFKDLFPKEPFEYKKFEIPKEEVIPPPESISQQSDSSNQEPPAFTSPTGLVFETEPGVYEYDSYQVAPSDSIIMDAGWGLYNYGESDLPTYDVEKRAEYLSKTTDMTYAEAKAAAEAANAKAAKDKDAWWRNLLPGKMVANAVGGSILDNQIDALDTQYDRLDPSTLQAPKYNFNLGQPSNVVDPNNLTVVTDAAGNVYYTEKDSKREKELKEKEKINSLNYDIEKATGFDLDLENLTPQQLASIESFTGINTNINKFDANAFANQTAANRRAIEQYIAEQKAKSAAAARSAAQAQAASALAQANKISTAEAGALMNQAREDLASERGAGYGNYGGGKGQAGTAHADNASDGDYGGGTGGQTAGDVAGDSWGSSPFSKGGYVGPLGNRR